MHTCSKTTNQALRRSQAGGERRRNKQVGYANSF